MNEFFYDTYALIELYEENPTYASYSAGAMHLTLLNLYEFGVFLFRAGQEAAIRPWFERLTPYIEEIDAETMHAAARLKHEHGELSMTDCVGYISAQRLGIRFLTGDRAFRGLRDVEWVPAQ
jgi:hypothetical protein